MTTIVLDYKKMLVACDSRMSKTDGSYQDCAVKVRRGKDGLFILSGATCDMNYFVDNYVQYGKVDLVDIDIDCHGIMIRGKKAYTVFITDGIFNEDLVLCNESLGSGGSYAVSALDHGKSAKEAVEYAMTKDMFTGGKVHVYDILKGTLI